MQKKRLFNYKFEGQKGHVDVGWKKANWYDFKNIHVPIDHISGNPVHWVYWEAEGDSYFADGADFNKFKSPEQLFRWADFLPAEEHDTLLNDIGQGYHWFHGNSPFHSRLARPTMLKKGQVELAFKFYADWYKWDGGKVSAELVGDPNTARVEMFIVDTGLAEQPEWQNMDESHIRATHSRLQESLSTLPGKHDDWFIVNPATGLKVFRKTIDVPKDGLYLLVYGAMTVWAVSGGRGHNGLWVRRLGAEEIVGEPTTTPDPVPDPDPTPDPTPEPVDQRGKPRVQYERTYVLLHTNVTESMAVEIFRQARKQGKTVGYSADDAGIGDLDKKFVEVYGWPAAEEQDLIDFYNKFYPGTQVAFKPIG